MISKINNYKSPPFQGLIVSDSLNANKSFNQIKDIILKNKLDRKRNVDVILDYNNSTDKFYGIISSKKQGIPENPANTCEISTDKKDISVFKKWVNEWNKAYSKKELELRAKILSMIEKH